MTAAQLASRAPEGAPFSVCTRLHVADAEIAVRRAGRGPALVCLHAIGHDGRDFEDLAARMGDACEIIALDWPGQGESPDDPVPPSSRRYGELLLGTLDQLELGDVVLLGNSVGGGAAICAAAARPERVRGLVLCNTAGLIRSSPLVRLACRWQARKFARGAAGEPRFAADYRRYYERTVLTGPQAAARREEIIANGYRCALVLQRAWQAFGEPAADLRSLAPQVTCPVLFAWARRDRQIRWSLVRAGARRFPSHEVEFFDASHAAFLESPDAFERSLTRFLEALPDDATGRERGTRGAMRGHPGS